MTIVFLITGMGRGGAEMQVATLALHYKKCHHKVEIVSMIDPTAKWPELVQAAIPVHSLGMNRRRANLLGFMRCCRLLRAIRPDVVHSHMIHANILGRVACLFARGVPHISTAQNIYEGGRIRMLAYRLTNVMSCLSTNVSQKAFDHYIKIKAFSIKRARYIPNAVDLIRFKAEGNIKRLKRLELGVGDDEFLWLAVGRINVAKDYPNLIHAARLLKATVSRRWRIFIVGKVDGYTLLEQDISEAGLAGRVLWLGSRDDIPDIMRASDAYVMSSVWEGLPMVLLEAAASGLPIVATKVGGNEEVVSNGRHGYLVPPGNAGELSEAMARLMALSNDERTRMGNSVREVVERRYDIAKIAATWLDIYRNITR